MASNSEQELISVIQETFALDYVLVSCTAMAMYDYVLNFPLEVEFIWNRNRTSTTLVYMALRYLGLVIAIFQMVGNLDIPLPGTYSCFSLWAVTELVTPVVMVFLQGMMTMRVYTLLGRSRKLLFPLLAFYGVVQGTNIALACLLTRSIVYSDPESSIFGIYLCDFLVPTSLEWIFPASSAILLAYETVLCGLVLTYAVKHLPSGSWKNPLHSANTLMTVFVRDNLVYFFIAFTSILFGALQLSPFIQSVAYENVNNVLQTIVLTMLGPWMIISLRRSYEKDPSNRGSEAYELSTAAFATVQIPEGEVEV